jgi:uncharacterized protein YjbI with pentapeptide repeats
MANPEHLQILKQGVEVWNTWIDESSNIEPDLRDSNLRGANLSGANLSGVDFDGANLSVADLSGTDFIFTSLGGTDLSFANLSNADLSFATLITANLRGATLVGANFTNAILASTIFADNDLSRVKSLETVKHYAPSTIGIDTLYKSAGKIPEVFLRGCGLPDDFITFIPSHFGIQQAIQFYSCFISYSHKDEEFARRLFSRMREANLRVWYAPEEMKGGQKLHEQIFSAIQVHDKLLLVLSENSLKSEWVATEIRRARKVEREENRRKLFPIRLVDFQAIANWEQFDADSGKDLGVELREYFIPDFSNWKDHDSFEKAFNRLLRDLKAEEKSDSKQ